MVGLKSSHGHLPLPGMDAAGQRWEGAPLPFMTSSREKEDGLLKCIQGKVTLLQCLAGHQQQWQFQLSKNRNKTGEGGWEILQEPRCH